MFRFAILGAAKIAPKFVEAARMEGAQIVAVASKSAERAERFAAENEIEAWYDDYGKMLDEVKPDCCYIATTPDSHFPLTMLCLSKGYPVICEKAMFLNKEEAQTAFAYAKEKNLFLMEAMWSRFLPATRVIRQWVKEKKCGDIYIAECSIGFRVPEGDDNRYRSKALGGGAARDILVYAYEQTDYVLDREEKSIKTDVVWGKTGVDMTDHVSVTYEKDGQTTICCLTTSFDVPVREEMALYGDEGRIVMPYPHYPSEVILYNKKGEVTEHFVDKETKNGFVYEIREVMNCIKEGKNFSDIETPEATIRCAALFDLLEQ